ncbi:MAG: hypothetical protein K2K56_12610 [Lachnospiraceae bacterium]|nr:hypothetical protein [Lachnospiraceae bacterium]MDE6627196.1 hypothetical protein [Lachnospiraceae bacterium]
MKINSSQVSVESGRTYTNTAQVTQATLMRQSGTNNVSYTSSTFMTTYSQYSGTAASRQYDSFIRSNPNGQNSQPLVSDLYSNLANNTVTIEDAKSALEKFHEDLIKRMEQLMERIRQQLLGRGSSASEGILDLTTTNEPGTFWTKQNYQKTTITETETTTFNGKGSVVTADGRSIDFNISMQMSREFMETSESLSSGTEYILTDPLVIQLKDAPETISDQKWLFDIDGDGVKEEISQLAAGNAFLALDANGNGKIDDGSELFGTKSGNGFKDLAAYDEDGNGWIDENDSVYSKLKVWVKDAAGNDKLMGLGQADIGAIYLGSAGTQFSHNKADTNETQAVVRQTGFFLHESTGSAGIMQQIDFAAKQPGNVA